MSEINLPLSPINLFFIHKQSAVKKLMYAKQFHSVNIPRSNWFPVFYVAFIPVFFFSMSLMTASLCEILKIFVWKAWFTLSIREVFSSSQKVFSNSFVNPSLSGVLLFFILVMELNRSVSVILFSHRSYCSFFNFLVLRELRNRCFSALVFEKFCLKSVS